MVLPNRVARGQVEVRPALGLKVFLEAAYLRPSCSGFTQEKKRAAKDRATNKSLIRARKQSLLSVAIHYISRSPMTSFSISCSLLFIRRALLGPDEGEEAGFRVPALS